MSEGERVQEPDPALLLAATLGDQAAFSAIVRAWQEPVWRFLRHLVHDQETAEDLAQEVFLRAHRGLAGFRHRSRFSTWLFAIARNAATDLHRQEARAEAAHRLTPLPAAVAPPDDDVVLRAALAALSPRAREALVAVEVLGLTYREAAAVLGVPEGTVKSRVFHARRSVVAWFGDTEGRHAGGTNASGTNGPHDAHDDGTCDDQ